MDKKESNLRFLPLILILFSFNFAVEFSYKADNFFQQRLNNGNFEEGFFRSENYFKLSTDNISIFTEVWLQAGRFYTYNNPGSQDLVQINDFAVVIPTLHNVNLSFFTPKLNISLGRGFYESSYGFYYKPNYVIENSGAEFFNPWIDYSGPTISIDPSDSFGFDLGFDLYGDIISYDSEQLRYQFERNVGDYFVFLRPTFGKKNGVNLKAQLEYYGYFNNFSFNSIRILNHLSFLGLKLEVPLNIGTDSKLDIMVTSEFHDLAQAANTGSSVVGLYLKRPSSFVKRLALETKILYNKQGFQEYSSNANRESGFYLDIWFDYKQFYSIVFIQSDDFGGSYRLGLQLGGRFEVNKLFAGKGKTLSGNSSDRIENITLEERKNSTIKTTKSRTRAKNRRPESESEKLSSVRERNKDRTSSAVDRRRERRSSARRERSSERSSVRERNKDRTSSAVDRRRERRSSARRERSSERSSVRERNKDRTSSAVDRRRERRSSARRERSSERSSVRERNKDRTSSAVDRRRERRSSARRERSSERSSVRERNKDRTSSAADRKKERSSKTSSAREKKLEELRKKRRNRQSDS